MLSNIGVGARNLRFSSFSGIIAMLLAVAGLLVAPAVAVGSPEITGSLLGDNKVKIVGSNFASESNVIVTYAFIPIPVTVAVLADTDGLFEHIQDVPNGFYGLLEVTAKGKKRNGTDGEVKPTILDTDGSTTNTVKKTVTTSPDQKVVGKSTVLSPLNVSSNKRYLVNSDGTPFFWMGDTAWGLFQRTTQEDVVKYLDTRQKQGFNVVQAVGIFVPGEANPMGQKAFNGDITNLNEEYWQHVDFVINETQKRNMHMAFLPAWLRNVGNQSLTTENAAKYGEILGKRYKDKNLIWVLGGDSPEPFPELTREMARGIAIGVSGSEDYSNVLMTFHPQVNSSAVFHNDDWLDFNMIQSSHCQGRSYEMVASDYGLSPIKPTIDSEPLYEDHPMCWEKSQGYSTPEWVRSALYGGVFAGGLGITYGNQSVWQMYEEGRNPEGYPRKTWQEALNAEVAGQIIHLRNLMESHSLETRVPDQTIVLSEQGEHRERIHATRDSNGSYVMVYLPPGKGATIDMTKVSGDLATVTWYSPSTGESTSAGTEPTTGQKNFTAPDGQDWVLLLEASK